MSVFQIVFPGLESEELSAAKGFCRHGGHGSPCCHQCMPYCAQSYGGGFRHHRPSGFLNRPGPRVQLSTEPCRPDRELASRTCTPAFSPAFSHGSRPRRLRTCLHFQASIGMAAMRAPTSRSAPSRFAFTSPRSRKLRSFSDNSKRNASPSLHSSTDCATHASTSPASRNRSRGTQMARLRRNSRESHPMASVETLRQSRRLQAPSARTAALIQLRSSPSISSVSSRYPVSAASRCSV